ncbi:MAG: hypothetical protein CVU56_16880, partial [Deltaproteobacteria bacterium HGW-Deltaproteobacteria-14]
MKFAAPEPLRPERASSTPAAPRWASSLTLVAVVALGGCGHTRLEALGVPVVEGDGSAQVARVADAVARSASDPQ